MEYYSMHIGTSIYVFTTHLVDKCCTISDRLFYGLELAEMVKHLSNTYECNLFVSIYQSRL